MEGTFRSLEFYSDNLFDFHHLRSSAPLGKIKGRIYSVEMPLTKLSTELQNQIVVVWSISIRLIPWIDIRPGLCVALKSPHAIANELSLKFTFSFSPCLGVGTNVYKHVKQISTWPNCFLNIFKVYEIDMICWVMNRLIESLVDRYHARVW